MEVKNKQKSPLAYKLRPKNLEEFFGQTKAVGPKSFLYGAIKEDRVPSLVFWGPPGSGKTTLASIIAGQTDSVFLELSAVTSGVKDLRKIIDKTREAEWEEKKTILFIDEIHRWNKNQQDALLPHIEDGTITLIGATTENPGFSINSPLLSRIKVVTLEALKREDINQIIKKALTESKAKASEEAIKSIERIANGDARSALNILESCLAEKPKEITSDLVKKIMENPRLLHDRQGEEHYNLASALIKSMRGSDGDAALYWLARLLEGGEDPVFVARRLVIFASEDIGLANNSALLLANATFDACRNIGMPECWINLSHAVVYLAKSPKNNATYEAYKKAKQDVYEYGNLPIPLYLRNAPTEFMKNLGYGQGYKYPHSENDQNQDYLPPELKNKKYLGD